MTLPRTLHPFVQILWKGQTPRQIARGVVLGMFIGFCPLLTLQSFLILFLVLILDVNIAASAVAAIGTTLLAFAFNPVFHRLGLFLLVDCAFFLPLWTALYNAPIAPLTRFYNTLVFGSFVTTLILALPVYAGVARFVRSRQATSNADIGGDGLIRKRAVYFILFPVALIAGLALVFIDAGATAAFERVGERVFHARVEIENLHLSLFPLGIGFAHLAVGDAHDPWKNVFQSGNVRFALNTNQLLRAKFIVESMEVDDVILGADRETNGSLAPSSFVAEKEHAASSEPNEVSTLSGDVHSVQSTKKSHAPMLNLDRIRKEFRADSVLNPGSLRALRSADALLAQIKQDSLLVSRSSAEMDTVRKELQSVELSARTIDTKAIKTAAAGKTAFERLESAAGSLRRARALIQIERSMLDSAYRTLSSSSDSLNILAREDFAVVQENARLPDVSMKDLSELLFGNELFARLEHYLSWLDLARNALPSFRSNSERGQPRPPDGQNIYFPAERSYPKFWIRRVLLSGGTDRLKNPEYFHAVGRVDDISSDQRATGKALDVDIDAQKGEDEHLHISARFDRRTPASYDSCTARVSGIRMQGIVVGSQDFVPSKLSRATVDGLLSIFVPSEGMRAGAELRFEDVQFEFERPATGEVERMTEGVLRSLKTFAVRVGMRKSDGTMETAFSTDLDGLLASKAKKIIGDQIGELQRDLKSRYDALVGGKRREVDAMLGARRGEAEKALKPCEDLLTSDQLLVASRQKEVEAQLGAQQGKAQELNKRAGDALKRLKK